MATHKINLKFFEVDDMAIFIKKYVLHGLEVLFEEASFGMCKSVPPTATRALFARGINWQVTCF